MLVSAPVLVAVCIVTTYCSATRVVVWLLPPVNFLTALSSSLLLSPPLSSSLLLSPPGPSIP
jgi:hypothetical protein